MIRERNGKLEVVVYQGRDPATGKERRPSRTVPGTTKADWKRARRIENELLREAAELRKPTTDKTFRELVDVWLKVARHEKSTVLGTESYLRNQILPHLGDVPVAEMTKERLDTYYVMLEHSGGKDGRPLAAATVIRIHGIVKAALNYALQNEWIDRNPATRAAVPSAPELDPQPPTVAEIRQLIEYASVTAPDMVLFLRLSATMGTRPGGVCGLQWKDVDLDRGEVRKAAAVKRSRAGPYLGETKTGARSWAAIGPATTALLTRWRQTQEARAAEFGGELGADAFVFSDALDGSTFWNPQTISKRFYRLRSQAGVSDTVKLKQCRHFVATELLDAGVALTVVSGRLDHKRTSTTANVYAGRRRASDQAAAALMDQILDG